MRLLILAALLVAVPVAQAQFTVEFDSPAQFGPTSTQDNLTWALIVFEPADVAHLTLVAHSVDSGTNHTHLRAKTLLSGLGQSNAPKVSSQPIDWDGPMDVDLRVGLGWSSIWIEGKNIQVSIANATSRLVAPAPSADLVSSTAGIPPGEYRLHERNETRLESLPSPGLSFTVEGDVRVIEWHNVTTSCPSNTCPDGARSSVVTQSPSFLATSHFSEWTLQGTLVGSGTASAVTVGGPRPGIAATGSIRLPAAKCSCEVDLDGTLLAHGSTALTSIEPLAGDRLRAQMDVSQATVKVDEGSIPVAAWAVPAAGAAAITVFVAWKLVAALLFSRLTDPFSAPRRRIMDHVLANPGITFRELQRALKIGNGSTTYHLAILSRAGMIAEYQDGNRRRLYENHDRYSSSWRVVALLREDKIRRLFDWLNGNAGVTQRDILNWGQEQGWKRTAIQERLRRLEDAGLLNVQRIGPSKMYRAKPPTSLATTIFPGNAQVGLPEVGSSLTP